MSDSPTFTSRPELTVTGITDQPHCTPQSAVQNSRHKTDSLTLAPVSKVEHTEVLWDGLSSATQSVTSTGRSPTSCTEPTHDIQQANDAVASALRFAAFCT